MTLEKIEEITVLHAIEAWRSWKLLWVRNPQGGGRILLRSLVETTPWFPNQEMTAFCSSARVFVAYHCKGQHENGVPAQNGCCGIYACKTLQEAFASSMYPGYYRGTIVGKVKLWGTIFEHKDNWYRAQYAYPLALVAGVCGTCEKPFPISSLQLQRRTKRARQGYLKRFSSIESTHQVVCRKCKSGLPQEWVKPLCEMYEIEEVPFL